VPKWHVFHLVLRNCIDTEHSSTSINAVCLHFAFAKLFVSTRYREVVRERIWFCYGIIISFRDLLVKLLFKVMPQIGKNTWLYLALNLEKIPFLEARNKMT